MAKPLIDFTLAEVFTHEFINACYKTFGKCGVYSFWHSHTECVYIGMSKDIGNRMQGSFKDRVLHYQGQAFFSYYECGCIGEAEELESALIMQVKPALNRDYRKAKKSSFDASSFSWNTLAMCKRSGVLAFRHGSYVIYPHGSIHADEELRLRAIKEDRRKKYMKSLAGCFSGGTE